MPDLDVQSLRAPPSPLEVALSLSSGSLGIEPRFEELRWIEMVLELPDYICRADSLGLVDSYGLMLALLAIPRVAGNPPRKVAQYQKCPRRSSPQTWSFEKA